MFKNSTISVASPIVASLQNEGISVQPKSSHYPVGVMSGHYSIASENSRRDLNNDDYAKLRERFAELNQQQAAMTADEYDELVGLMAHGLKRMMYNVQQVVVPAVNKLAESMRDACGPEQRLPQTEIKVFDYHPIHQDVGLVEHIMGGEYDGVRRLESYRSFIIEMPSMETLIEWITINKHTDRELAVEWAQSLGAQDIEQVWRSLFMHDRTIHMDGGMCISPSRLPRNVDKVLVAYLLTSHLRDEPQDVTGESVSLHEWDETIGLLHRYLGALLNYAYQKRGKDIQRGRIILEVENLYGGSTGGETLGDMTIHVNGDVYGEWLESGGNVKQILGAAVAAPNRVHREDLDSVRDDLIATWDRKYYMFRQMKADRFQSNLRQHWTDRVISYQYDLEDLPQLTHQEIQERAARCLRGKTQDELSDLPRTAKDLVCSIYYPNTPYREFLDSMDRIAGDIKGMSAREASLLSLVDLVASWLAKQVTAIPVELDIDPVRSPSSDPVSESSVEEPVQVGEGSTLDDTESPGEPPVEETPAEAEEGSSEIEEEEEATQASGVEEKPSEEV